MKRKKDEYLGVGHQKWSSESSTLDLSTRICVVFDIYSLVDTINGYRNAAHVVIHIMLINEKEDVNVKLIGG